MCIRDRDCRSNAVVILEEFFHGEYWVDFGAVLYYDANGIILTNFENMVPVFILVTRLLTPSNNFG